MKRVTRRLAIPATLTLAMLGAGALPGCSGSTATDAGDTASEATTDVGMVDAFPDCAFTCMNESFPDQDGGITTVVIYADGAQLTDAVCDAPPLDFRCGV